ncbi:hypothetical protein [Helicobacter fennelliae]|uniref:Ferrochelatase n=1 Tax=Helicobacter fennelliae MRY12-0050 TaxID=1325130 RepID=T1CMF6_9HELI|nr:hypothetical protein [Helicobacter fennelliae]GAD17919.1 hypothetical protein HFN_1478 [Helicobacter fennelliae MRY12-0050]STP07654.1 ferrochelatase [Helicobacter fennelliae]
MKIKEAVEIICGTSINSPAIGSFSGFATKLEDVKRGFLFFAKNPNEINAAIKAGAFGIVFDSFVQMEDGEIAWIKVASIEDSIIRLTRYKLLSENIQVFYVNAYQYAIAQNIITSDDTALFDDNPSKLLELLEKKHPTKIIIKNQTLLDFVLEYTPCVILEKLPFDISNPSSLFEPKFYYKLNLYQTPLPEVFLPDLGAVIEMCVNANIEFNLNNFEVISSLLPLSLNQEAKILPFGQSPHVAIPTNDKEIFLRYALIFHKHAKWGKVLFLVPKILQEQNLDLYDLYEARIGKKLESIQYNVANELPHLLRSHAYNFGLIFGIGLEGLQFILNQQKPIPDPTLF